MTRSLPQLMSADASKQLLSFLFCEDEIFSRAGRRRARRCHRRVKVRGSAAIGGSEVSWQTGSGQATCFLFIDDVTQRDERGDKTRRSLFNTNLLSIVTEHKHTSTPSAPPTEQFSSQHHSDAEEMDPPTGARHTSLNRPETGPKPRSKMNPNPEENQTSLQEQNPS